MIWIEFIGLWASGKSVRIERLNDELLRSGYKITTIHSHFGLSRWRKLYEILLLFLKRPSAAYYLLKLYILVRKHLDFSQATLSSHLLGTLLRTYLYRHLTLIHASSDFVLWEGEFHILPLILSRLDTTTSTSLYRTFTHLIPPNDTEFIVLDISAETSLRRVKRDYADRQNAGAFGQPKARFDSKQYRHLPETLRRVKENELELITYLLKSGSSVRRFDTSGPLNTLHLLPYIKSKAL